MKKILTLAIPAYNMEQYLGRCLDSVLLPGIENDIEVLVINDGSKDNTLAIAKEYEQSHDQVIHVIDKPNGGWGSAINRAIKEATGTYFKILDSDDWFESNAFVEFIALIKKSEADIVASSYTRIYDDIEPVRTIYPKQICGVTMPYSEYLNKYYGTINIPMASLCYRTDILKKHKIAVSDRYYADVEFALLPLAYVKDIEFTDLDVYQYYLGRPDHSTSLAGYNAHYNDYIEMMMKLVGHYETVKHQLNKEISSLFISEIKKHVKFSYYLLMSPAFKGLEADSKNKLRLLEADLKKRSAIFYSKAGNEKVRGFIPYIALWRLTGINVLKLRSWI